MADPVAALRRTHGSSSIQIRAAAGWSPLAFAAAACCKSFRASGAVSSLAKADGKWQRSMPKTMGRRRLRQIEGGSVFISFDFNPIWGQDQSTT
jgi:hypothetical protein